MPRELVKIPSSEKSKIFILNKPQGITSFDFLKQLKRNLTKDFHKLGHFGTLDMFATGVLIVGMDKALKLNELSQEYFHKTYRAKGLIGKKTDTGDPKGEVLETLSIVTVEKIKTISRLEIAKVLDSFVGKYLQAPPTYSAAKFQGKRLSDLARSGIIIEKEKKEREIFEIELINYSFPEIEFRVTVSTGTYIRTLFEDFCSKIGGIGHLLTLERESIGPYDVGKTIPVNDFNRENFADIFLPRGIKVTDFLPFQFVELSEKQTPLFSNGNFIRYYQKKGDDDFYIKSNYVWVYDNLSNLLGLGYIDSEKENQVCPKFLF